MTESETPLTGKELSERLLGLIEQLETIGSSAVAMAVTLEDIRNRMLVEDSND